MLKLPHFTVVFLSLSAEIRDLLSKTAYGSVTVVRVFRTARPLVESVRVDLQRFSCYGI